MDFLFKRFYVPRQRLFSCEVVFNLQKKITDLQTHSPFFRNRFLFPRE